MFPYTILILIDLVPKYWLIISPPPSDPTNNGTKLSAEKIPEYIPQCTQWLQISKNAGERFSTSWKFLFLKLSKCFFPFFCKLHPFNRTAKELRLFHKLWFSKIFQTTNSVRSNNPSVKYRCFTPSGYKVIETRKYEFVEKDLIPLLVAIV